MTKRPINTGIVGATGMVGEVFLQLLNERKFPVGELRLFASERSAGATRKFNGKDLALAQLSPGCFKGLDLVFFSSGDDISKEWGPRAVADGAFAVDNSAAYRMSEAHALVVPEVNGDILPKPGQPALIANPNCSTIQLVLALAPLQRDFGIESVHVATYQAVSGAGRAGQEELAEQIKNWSPERAPSGAKTFPHPIALNVIPEIGSFQDNGFCTEETKIIRESKKILRTKDVRISAMVARVPVWNSHSEAVWVRVKKSATREQILASLKTQPGLRIDDNLVKHLYPLATEVSGKDDVSVGRIHQDLDDPNTWLMWIVGDNLRKGAALNGLQIAERIFDLKIRP